MNKLYKSLVYDMQVSLSVLETTDMVNDAIKIHRLDDASAEILGGMLTAAAYMAGCLKSERGAVSLTVKSGDGSATVSVSGDSKGHIRGYIDGGEGGLRGGTLTVIKDDGFYRPFVGTCELVSSDVSLNLMEYFDISEQIPTAVMIDVKIKDGRCVAAGGVIMQLMPGVSEENSAKAGETMQSIPDIAEEIERVGAEGIMNEYFASETERGGAYLTFPEYRCNCSRGKIRDVIVSLGKSELQSIISQEGEVRVHCHYCNKDYVFTEKDVEEIFADSQ